MKKLAGLTLTAFAAIMAFMPVTPAFAAATGARAELQYTVKFDNISVEEVYGMLADFRNDDKWFSSTKSTTLTKEGVNGTFTNAEWLQTYEILGFTEVVEIRTLADNPNREVVFVGDGILTDYTSQYQFRATADGGVEWIFRSTYEAPQLVEEFFQYLLVGEFYNLISVMGTTGTVTLDNLVITQF